jgi:hypothetical protein
LLSKRSGNVSSGVDEALKAESPSEEEAANVVVGRDADASTDHRGVVRELIAATG